MARRFVRDSRASRVLAQPQRDDLELLTSELVTNVVRHAGTDVDVTLHLDDGWVCLVVGDHSTSMPHVRDSPGEAGGWGLRLVDEVSSQWGVETRPGGKLVWVLLPRPGVDAVEGDPGSGDLHHPLRD
jgi:anti-sigma regulatory factor (Ser/Thr protein kinase)